MAEKNPLTKLTNIGDKMAIQLNDVGIYTFEELVKIGSKEAWLRIREKDESACYNRLCGIQGAIVGIRWHNLSDEVKKDLKEFYTANKK